MAVDRDLPPRDGRRRPTPLLLAAATALILVLGLGVVVVATRTSGADTGDQGGAESPIDPGAGVAATVDAAVRPTAAEPSPPSPATPSTTAAAPETPDGSVDELPLWARPPRPNFSHPFPDGAGYDPPLPPVKIPAWMLTEAGPAGFQAVTDGSPPGDATSPAGS